MNYPHPGPGNMGMQMQQYSEVPTVRIAGASAGVPGIAYEVLAPNGMPMAKLEVYPLSMSLPPSGPVREGFARPSPDDHMRRRAASIASGTEYDYHGQNFGNAPRQLIDRIQSSPDLMNFNSPKRFSNNNTPVPPLTRSDVTNSSGTGNGGFSRPQSRASNASSNRSNAYGPINYGNTRGNIRHQPYSQAGSRPFSSNSDRSQNSFRSNTSVRLVKDTYYPRYNGNERDGTYERLPEDRSRPWFTPVPERSTAGIVCRNLVKGTTLEDVYSTFADYGNIDTIEFLEEYEDAGVELLSVLLIYDAKDDADRAIAKMHGVEADSQTLVVTHVNPDIIARPFATSTEKDKRLTCPRWSATPQHVQVKDEPRPFTPRRPIPQDDDVAMSSGSRTPARTSGSRTPRPESSSEGKSGNNGWGSQAPSGSGSTAPTQPDLSTKVSVGWGQPETTTAAPDNSGWGPSVTDTSGWGK